MDSRNYSGLPRHSVLPFDLFNGDPHYICFINIVLVQVPHRPRSAGQAAKSGVCLRTSPRCVRASPWQWGSKHCLLCLLSGAGVIVFVLSLTKATTELTAAFLVLSFLIRGYDMQTSRFLIFLRIFIHSFIRRNGEQHSTLQIRI